VEEEKTKEEEEKKEKAKPTRYRIAIPTSFLLLAFFFLHVPLSVLSDIMYVFISSPSSLVISFYLWCVIIFSYFLTLFVTNLITDLL